MYRKLYILTHKDMIIVTPAEFRANQKKFFDLSEKQIVIVARKNESPIIVKPWDEEDYPTKEELEAIQEGLNDIREGRITFIDPANVWERIG